ncbi:MAG: DsrE/DsrF/DrsH-like family protein, partial [Hyphomicrobium sp.]
LKKGVAEGLRLKPGDTQTIYDIIKEAHGAGVKFICCSPTLDLFDFHKSDLIPECDRIVGGAYLIEAVMEGGAKVLTY